MDQLTYNFGAFWALVAQDIVLLVTVVVIAVYTRETMRLRGVTAKQVRILQRERREKDEAAKPHFDMSRSLRGIPETLYRQAYLDVVNRGGPVHRLEITTTSEDTTAGFGKPNYMQHNDEDRITFQFGGNLKNYNEGWGFTIHSVTAQGKKDRQHYKILNGYVATVDEDGNPR